MLKVKKINEKVEIKDLKLQGGDPCKRYYDKYGRAGMHDCLYDCKGGTPRVSEAY